MINDQKKDTRNRNILLLTSIGLIADFIAIYTFFVPQNISSISSIDNVPILISIIIVAYLTYWGIIRMIYEYKLKNERIDYQNFIDYYELDFWKIRSPFIFIPFVLLLGVTYAVIYELWNHWIAIISLCLIVYFFRRPVINKNSKQNTENNQLEFQKLFLKSVKRFYGIIEDELEKEGYLVSLKLSRNHPYDHNLLVVVMENHYENSDNNVLFSRMKYPYPERISYSKLKHGYGVKNLYAFSDPQFAVSLKLEIGILYYPDRLDEEKLEKEIQSYLDSMNMDEYYFLAIERSIPLKK